MFPQTLGDCTSNKCIQRVVGPGRKFLELRCCFSKVYRIKNSSLSIPPLSSLHHSLRAVFKKSLNSRAERFYRYRDIYQYFVFSDKVSIFQPQVSFFCFVSFFLKQTLLKSQTLQLVKTQNINIIQNNAGGVTLYIKQ